MKKNILLTFDYELFLGQRSGSVDNCLIRPTNKILEVLKRHGAKAVFFIDTTYLYRLKELSKSNLSTEKDLHKIKEQLLEMARDGHYLFHHIHPHWLDATYLKDENQWDLSKNDKFTWSIISDNEREELINFSTVFLKKIYSDTGKDIYPDGYRAGGLFIEPFSAFKHYFIKYGIRYNFDVIPGEKISGDKVFYDFSNCPDKPFYNFIDDVCSENKNADFTEFTIPRFKITGPYKIANGLYYRLFEKGKRKHSDGKCVNNVSLGIKRKLIKNYFVSWHTLSVELMNPIMVSHFLKLTRKENYMHFLSHPKLILPHNLEQLNKYLEKIVSKYEVEFDFKKFDSSKNSN